MGDLSRGDAATEAVSSLFWSSLLAQGSQHPAAVMLAAKCSQVPNPFYKESLWANQQQSCLIGFFRVRTGHSPLYLGVPRRWGWILNSLLHWWLADPRQSFDPPPPQWRWSSVSCAESLYPALQVSRASCLHCAVQNGLSARGLSYLMLHSGAQD